MFGTHWILAMVLKLLLADENILREAKIFPRMKYVQFGSNATFFCKVNSSLYTSAQLFWTLNPNITAGVKEGCLTETVRYITIQNISAETVEITCKASKHSSEDLHLDRIFLTTGKSPEIPHNITCTYFYKRNFTCSWNSGKHTGLPTNSSLNRIMPQDKTVLCWTINNSCTSVYLGEKLDGEYEVQVKAENELGKVTSPVMSVNFYRLVKLDPPNSLSLVPFCNENPLLSLSWRRPPLAPDDLDVNCSVRYKPLQSVCWNYHHNLYMGKEQQMSYNITGLEAFTDYSVSMSCIGNDGQIFWSSWSEDITQRTSEKAPSHRAELWRVITRLNKTTLVRLMWKEKLHYKPSGRTQGFVVQWHPEDGTYPLQNRSTTQNEMLLSLPDQPYVVSVMYYNSAGSSPRATLRIPASNEKPQSLIRGVQVYIRKETVNVMWNSVDERINTYVVEWCRDSILNRCSNISFHQVENSSEWTGYKGMFDPYTRYQISVYPIIEEKPEAPMTSYFYVKEAAPLYGPNSTVLNLRDTQATIKWDLIRQDDANGFLTSYSVVYSPPDGNETVVTVSSDVSEYTLQSLRPNTLYAVHVVASTREGNTSGLHVHFTTPKYKREEYGHVIGTIGVLVTLVVLCGIAYTRKKETIKHLIWPDVPDPAHSSISQWSLDCAQTTLLQNPGQIDGVFPAEDLQVLHAVYINDKALLLDEGTRKQPSADTRSRTDLQASPLRSSPVHYATTEISEELLESLPLLQSTSCSMTSSQISLLSSLGDPHAETQEAPHVLELDQLCADILVEVNPYLKNSINTREIICSVMS